MAKSNTFLIQGIVETSRASGRHLDTQNPKKKHNRTHKKSSEEFLKMYISSV